MKTLKLFLSLVLVLIAGTSYAQTVNSLYVDALGQSTAFFYGYDGQGNVRGLSTAGNLSSTGVVDAFTYINVNASSTGTGSPVSHAWTEFSLYIPSGITGYVTCIPDAGTNNVAYVKINSTYYYDAVTFQLTQGSYNIEVYTYTGTSGTYATSDLEIAFSN
jgi:hypothetical protein